MTLVQLEDWEKDLIFDAITSDIGHPDEVSNGLKELIAKLIRPKESKIKLKFQVLVQNNGDGSATPYFFNEEKEAEEFAGKNDERLCDDVFEQTIVVNGLGEIKDIPKREED